MCDRSSGMSGRFTGLPIYLVLSCSCYVLRLIEFIIPCLPNIIRNIGRLLFDILNGPNETLVYNSLVLSCSCYVLRLIEFIIPCLPNIIRNIGRLLFDILNGPNETLVYNSCMFLPKNLDYATYFWIPPKIFL